VVELTIRVAQPEHEGRLGPIAGHPDDDAVYRADLLDLDPFALPGQGAAVGTFGHHAFEARHEPQPFLSFQDRPSVRDQLQERASSVEQGLEMLPALAQWRVGEVAARKPVGPKKADSSSQFRYHDATWEPTGIHSDGPANGAALPTEV
jgi:hypothetical protein